MVARLPGLFSPRGLPNASVGGGGDERRAGEPLCRCLLPLCVVLALLLGRLDKAT